jgi:hypothetical protein
MLFVMMLSRYSLTFLPVSVSLAIFIPAILHQL